MDVTVTGEPVVTQEDPQVHVGVHIRQDSLTLTQGGEDFAVHHALVKFAAPEATPWVAEEVRFSAKGPDGKTVGIAVDLLNEPCNGPRDGVPTAVWKVVAFAATSAGDVGITYATPTHT